MPTVSAVSRPDSVRKVSVSIHVIGFVPPDDRWRKMRAVYDSCRDAGLDIPAEVADFFDGQAPDDNGQEVDLPHRLWSDDSRSGIEIDVAALPPSVQIIRFYNSW